MKNWNKIRKILAAIFAAVLIVVGGIVMNGSPRYFIVTFDLNGGVLVSGKTEQEVLFGKDLKPPVAKRYGYAFSGWDAELKEINKTTTVKAQWEELIAFNVIFDLDGGTLVNGELEQTVFLGSEIIPPVAVKEGYAFGGWDVEIGSIDEETTVTALWEEADYTVTFVMTTVVDGKTVKCYFNEQNAVPAVGLKEGASLGEFYYKVAPKNTQTIDYSFVGWTYNGELITKDTVFSEENFEGKVIELEVKCKIESIWTKYY